LPSGRCDLKTLQAAGLAEEAVKAYLSSMPLPRPASPRVLLADLKAFASERRPHQWMAMAFAIAMPIIIVVIFAIDGQTNIAPRAEIIYVESYPANRTDAQIIADQKKDQAAREAAQKERQRQWQKLDKSMERLGI
jgi:hypothetical protein